MKITWYFFDCKIAFQTTAPLLSEALPRHFKLFMRVIFPQQLELLVPIYQHSKFVQPVFLDGGNVRTVRHHGILNIKRYDFTGEFRHDDIQMYSGIECELLHLFASEELVSDDHGLVVRSQIVFQLDEQEKANADDSEQRNETSTIGSF